MQRNVARVSGERSVEEKEELNRKIVALEKQLEDQKSLSTILSGQVKRQETELKHATRKKKIVTEDLNKLEEAMRSAELQSDALTR